MQPVIVWLEENLCVDKVKGLDKVKYLPKGQRPLRYI